MSETIIYNASTNETTTETITEAIDTVVDNSAELATANSRIAELETIVCSLNDEIVSLKNKIESLNVELNSLAETKMLIADLKAIDPVIESEFITTLPLEQLKILKTSFTRIMK